MPLPTCECVSGFQPQGQLLANIYCALYSIAQGGGGGGLPDQTGHAGEFLTTDGSTASWAAISGGGNVNAAAPLTLNQVVIGQGGSSVATTDTPFIGNATGSSLGLESNITLGTGLTAGQVIIGDGGGFFSRLDPANGVDVLVGMPLTSGTLLVSGGPLGTPASGTLTNCTLPVGGLTGIGTGVASALAVNVGNAGAFVTFNGAGGTPSSMVGTNITGTAAGLTAGTASAVAVGGITGLGTGVATFLATPSSANLAAAVTGETGTGALVFGTSPTITTSIVAGGTSFALLNTTATTINFAGAATTLNVGTSATILNFGGGTTAAEFRFLEPSGSGTNYSSFKAQAQGANITYTLPATVGAAGTVLTDAAGNGTLSWATPSGSGNVTAAGTLTSNALVVGQGTTAVATVTTAAGFLTFAATPSSANLAALVTGETGSGALVFGTSPTITTPTLDGVTSTGATGTGNIVFSASPTLSGTVTAATVAATALNATTLNINGGSSGTVTVFGDVSSDNNSWAASRGALTFFDGTASTTLVGVLTSDTPSNGQVPTWNTGGTITWETPSGSGNVTAGGTLTSGAIVLGGGTTAVATTTTGTGVVTALGINTGSTGAFVVQNGALGTPASGNLGSCTADGTNAVGYRNVPLNAKTGSYTLLATDVGKVVPNTTGGWTVNNSVHAAGDVILVYNDSGSSQNITAGTITTMRLAGTATTGTRALAQRGIATLYFQSASEVVVSGAGVT